MLSKTLSIVAVGLAAVAAVASGESTFLLTETSCSPGHIFVGHPGEAHSLPRAELHARQLEANKRHLVARNCAAQIADFNAKRKVRDSAIFSTRQPLTTHLNLRLSAPLACSPSVMSESLPSTAVTSAVKDPCSKVQDSKTPEIEVQIILAATQ
jgi:hypothetical protein